ncbi:MAG: SurA N-terminal domain-containing protein [Burkholderiaceae bacterium]|nr:SurA N-terminal domain-containing protein [Burkholderiaceae bacterium]
MFDSIRKHQRLLQFVLLLLIFPAFAFFGISGYDRFFSDHDAVAVVDGSPISAQEYSEAQRRQLERLQQMLGAAADPALLNTPQARSEILDGLVLQRALALEAQRAMITVPDSKLREVIMEIPGLKGADGKFDVERYRTILAGQGKSEASFEYELRGQIAVQTLPDGITDSAGISQGVARALLTASEQQREVAELRFKPDDYIAKVKLADGAALKFYEANQKRFETPESAVVEFVVLSADEVAKSIKVDPEQVRSYYEQNQARYTRAEQRRARHILIAAETGASDEKKQEAKAKADQIEKALREGASFEELAKTRSDDKGSAREGGDLGYFTRDAMVKPFADKAFSMKIGETSAPVRSDFGYHIIRLVDIKAGQVEPFEKVRSQIEDEMRRQQARGEFAKRAEGFTNTVYEVSDTYKTAAEKYGVAIQRNEEVTRVGAKNLAADSPLNNPKLLKALFSEESIRERRNTDAIDVGNNRLVSARIIAHRPAKTPPFETVEAEVTSALMAREAARLAAKAGAEMLVVLKGKDGKGSKAEFSKPMTIGRGARGAEGIDLGALEAIFRLASKEVPGFIGFDRGSLGYSIFRVSKIVEPDAAKIDKAMPAFREQLARIYAQQELDAYLKDLKARSKVELHPERISAPGSN